VPHHRADVLAHAVVLLDGHGLAALTMRRLGTELGVQPSAIYHHFENKQTLLAAVADEIIARGAAAPGTAGHDAADWAERVRAVCGALRSAVLDVTDGADVVATAWAFGLGAQAPARALEQALAAAGADEELVAVASRALLHYVFGHTFEEQTARQAIGAGAVERSLESLPDFELGLDLVLDGLRARLRR